MAVLFGDADDFSMLRGIERGGSGRKRESNVETLALPVAFAGGGEKQAEAGDVDTLANFFERLRDTLRHEREPGR